MGCNRYKAGLSTITQVAAMPYYLSKKRQSSVRSMCLVGCTPAVCGYVGIPYSTRTHTCIICRVAHDNYCVRLWGTVSHNGRLRHGVNKPMRTDGAKRHIYRQHLLGVNGITVEPRQRRDGNNTCALYIRAKNLQQSRVFSVGYTGTGITVGHSFTQW